LFIQQALFSFHAYIFTYKEFPSPATSLPNVMKAVVAFLALIAACVANPVLSQRQDQCAAIAEECKAKVGDGCRLGHPLIPC
jgi:hypothetical protein